MPIGKVSIQLIAPASGATKKQSTGDAPIKSFHSTDCPSEWGLLTKSLVHHVKV